MSVGFTLIIYSYHSKNVSVHFSNIYFYMLDKLCFYVYICVLQRREIVTGTVEPTDEECEWTSDREEEEELAVSAC